jgi:hypothetical protein
MQLSFNPEKTRQHKNAMRNPFLKLGAALLVSLAIVSPLGAPKTALAESATGTKIVTGKYHCSPPKLVTGAIPKGIHTILVPTASDITLTEKNGSFFITLETGAIIPIEHSANGFTSKIKIDQDTVKSNGQFLDGGALRVEVTRSSPNYAFTVSNACKLIEPPKAAVMKAVFIRPSEGGAGLYSMFGNRASNGTTNVGCDTEICTPGSVSKDLLASGVTDVFIAFKTDGFAWSTGGKVGDLAYASQNFPNNIDPSIKAAQATGFDPIRKLIGSLRSTYISQNKTIRLHAWFPVFADSYAAQIEPQKAIYLQPNPILPFVMPTMPSECHSDSGAEPSNPKVIEYELNVIREILTNYPTLCGVNLDYIRYYFPDADCFTDDGKKAIRGLYSWKVNPQGIENFVQQVKAQFPGKVLSADVFVTEENRKLIGQAGIPKYLDIAMPMAYTDGNTIDEDSNEVKTWITDFQGAYPGTSVLPILRAFPLGTEKDLISKAIADIQTAVGVVPAGNLDLVSDINSQLKEIKSLNTSGYAIFNYVSILTSTGNKQLSTLKGRLGF